jgi:hypothetical protein
MKFAILLCVGMLTAGSLASAAKADWDGPKDMSKGCGDAVMKKLLADKETGSYITEEMTTSLEWYDTEKSAVSFTTNFAEDVRDGYITGEVAVSVKKGGFCVVGEVLNSSVGD